VSLKTLEILEPIFSALSIPSYKFDASLKTSALKFKSFPQIIYKHDNLTLVFEDEKTSENIEKWVKGRAHPQVVLYEMGKSQLRAHEELCVEYENCLIGKGLEFNLLNELSRRIDFVELQVFSVEGSRSLTLFQKFGEKVVEYNSSLELQQIESFLRHHLSVYLLPMERKYLDKLFNSGGNAVVLIRERKHKYLDFELENLEEQLRGKLYLMVVDVSFPLGKQVQEVLRIPDKKLPVLRIIECRGGSLNVTQFDLSDVITQENILKFVNNWENQFVRPFVLTQEIPKKMNENLVFAVVQETFKSVVLDSNEHFLVLVYAPWCSYSKAALVMVEQLSYDLRNLKNFKVGKIDGYNNQIGKDVKGFPTIRLYFKGREGVEIFEFLEERTVGRVKDFVFSHIKQEYKVDL
jgi:thiol-disulfide isomerase/thioredoxin